MLMMNETKAINTFDIPRGNIPALERKLKSLAKRASKLELGELLKWTLAESFQVEKTSASGRKYFVTYTPVTLTVAGDIVLPGGWHLVGVLDHTSADTPIIRSVPGEELPVEYRAAGPDCDHCKGKRRRNTTIVIRSEETRAECGMDEYKQVGSTCIADYLGHKSALDIATSYQYIGDFISGLSDEDGEFRRVTPSAWELADCLAFVAACVRLDGWAPRSNSDNPTANQAWSWFIRNFRPIVTKRDGTIYPPEVTDKDIELAAKALKWLDVQNPAKAKSDYIYNIQTIAKAETVTPKTIGMAASIIGTYKRDVERQLRYAAERKAKAAANGGHVSKWIGKDKERLRKLGITVLGTYETEGDYGLSTRVVFQDGLGNDFVWFASGSVELEQGASYIVDATVKRHNEFKGNKQTQVNRVRVAR